MPVMTRRLVLSALAAQTALPALANVVTSPRPRPRPAARPRADLGAASSELLSERGLSGEASIVVAEARSGTVRWSHQPGLGLPPASVAKAVTTAYAFDALGPGHRYVTRLLATGPVRDGRLSGDLVLAGGGDPTLDTAHLAALVDALRATGLREVTGAFRVWDGALPYVNEIVPSQPDHLGYNPSISGLNLNFNRVHFEWARQGSDYRTTMDARAGRLVPQVSQIGVRLSPEPVPVYTHTEDRATGRELWRVARPALGGAGARWLPVRRSALYAGDVFRTLARSGGLSLSAPQVTASEPPPGLPVLASHVSASLADIATGMLRFSTNLTAEVAGLSATGARRGAIPAGLADSAAEMTGWAQTAYGMSPATRFADHSGLNGAARITAQDMVRVLRGEGIDGGLQPVLREIGLVRPDGGAEPLRLWAKTGTLNFVSALAGYIAPARGPELVFAIFTADQDRRRAIPPGGEENPPGTAGWTRRSRAMQFEFVRLWAALA